MQRFEITVDGVLQPGDFATQSEADASAVAHRQSDTRRNVVIRQKQEMAPTPNDGLGTVQNVDPSKVLVQQDGVIRPQDGVVEGHGAAPPAPAPAELGADVGARNANAVGASPAATPPARTATMPPNATTRR